MPLTGLQDTLAAFDQVERDATYLLVRVTAGVVARVRAAAYAACPVGTGEGPFPGHVRDQIKTQVIPNEPEGAVFVERRGLGGHWGTDNVGVWIERGTVHQAPRPFLRPAAEAERARYLAELEQALESAARSTR